MESAVSFCQRGLLRPTYHRGVTLRNTFNPMRGPSTSPAPNSTCRDERTEKWMKSCSDVPKLLRKGKALFSHLNNLEREKFKVHLSKKCPTGLNLWQYHDVLFCYAYLSPALGWRNSPYGHVYVASSGSIVCRQWTWQHCCVRVCQRSLRMEK